MLAVHHPAFRLGFLDADRGAPLDHDAIRTRVAIETPATAFDRLPGGQDPRSFRFDEKLAQLRYEEGRQLRALMTGRVRGWSHPLFPPKAVVAFVRDFDARIQRPGGAPC